MLRSHPGQVFAQPQQLAIAIVQLATHLEHFTLDRVLMLEVREHPNLPLRFRGA